MAHSDPVEGGRQMPERKPVLRGHRHGRWYPPSKGGYSAVAPEEAEYIPQVKRTPPKLPPFNPPTTNDGAKRHD